MESNAIRVWHNLNSEDLSRIEECFDQSTTGQLTCQDLSSVQDENAEKSPDWVILSGTELLDTSSMPSNLDAPTLVWMKDPDIRNAVELMQKNIHELLTTEDLTLRTFRARLQSARRFYEEESSKKEEIQNLIEEVQTDPETGLESRGYFLSRSRNQLEENRSREEMLSLALIKVRGLADLLGETSLEKSSQILDAIGTQLKSKLDDKEDACRFSLDQFAIIFPESSGDASNPRTERICKAINRKLQKIQSSQKLQLGFKVGLAEFDPNNNPKIQQNTLEELLRGAEDALETAEDEGTVTVERRRYNRKDIGTVPVEITVQEKNIESEIDSLSQGNHEEEPEYVGLRLRSEHLLPAGAELTIEPKREDWKGKLFREAEGVIRWSRRDDDVGVAYAGVRILSVTQMSD
jgi:diguanylate cyclase (GGDEF)-like protein